MGVTRAQPSDWEELKQLYQRNHPHDNRGFWPLRWHSQAFVSRYDDHPGELQGFAMASYRGRTSRRHGVIQILEIAPEIGDFLRPLVERELVDTCKKWLGAQWCTLASVPALSGPEYAWLRRELGAESGQYGITIPLAARSPDWHWVLDGQTGMIYPEAGPEGAPPGPPPKPFQAPRQVWN